MKHLVEVGCVQSPSLKNFLTSDSYLEIIEPNPDHVSLLQDLYKDSPNVIIHPYAIWHTPGPLRFIKKGHLGFVEGVESPATNIYGYELDEADVIEVEAKTFDEFDDGTIDILDIDVEGAEWFVFEKMISRPGFIILEGPHNGYTNPNFDKIQEWWIDNGYKVFSCERSEIFLSKI